MPYPYGTLTTARTNTTPTLNNLAADINSANSALNMLRVLLGTAGVLGPFETGGTTFETLETLLQAFWDKDKSLTNALEALQATDKIVTGSSVPNATTGDIGDLYINTTAWVIYGPKQTPDPDADTVGARSGWGTATSITGPRGPQGIQGITGQPGETGPAGPAGAASTVPGPKGDDGADGVVAHLLTAANGNVTSSTLKAGNNVAFIKSGDVTTVNALGGGAAGVKAYLSGGGLTSLRPNLYFQAGTNVTLDIDEMDVADAIRVIINSTGGGGGGGGATPATVIQPGPILAGQLVGNLPIAGGFVNTNLTITFAKCVRYYPILVGASFNIDALGLIVTGVAASAHAKLGLYAATVAGKVGAKLAEVTVGLNNLGLQWSTVATTAVTPGVYYIGVTTDDGSGSAIVAGALYNSTLAMAPWPSSGAASTYQQWDDAKSANGTWYAEGLPATGAPNEISPSAGSIPTLLLRSA